jgi:hypothetical protein
VSASSTVVLRLGALTLDPALQPRLHDDPAYLEALTETVREGRLVKGDLPVVFRDGDTLLLADGWCRYAAHQAAGRTEMECEVRDGDRRAAWLFTRTEANRDHGRQYTAEEKRRRAVDLLTDPECRAWSDRELGRRCGVDGKTIAKYRAEVQPAEFPQAGDNVRRYTDPRTGKPIEMAVSGINAGRGRRDANPVRRVAEALGAEDRMAYLTGEREESDEAFGVACCKVAAEVDATATDVREAFELIQAGPTGSPVIGPTGEETVASGSTDDEAPRDAVGQPIPDALRPVFAAISLRKAQEIIERAVVADGLPGALSRLKKPEPGHLAYLPASQAIDHIEEAIRHARAADDLVTGNIPHAVCPSCHGARCEDCRNAGWVPAWRYAELTAAG